MHYKNHVLRRYFSKCVKIWFEIVVSLLCLLKWRNNCFDSLVGSFCFVFVFFLFFWGGLFCFLFTYITACTQFTQCLCLYSLLLRNSSLQIIHRNKHEMCNIRITQTFFFQSALTWFKI